MVSKPGTPGACWLSPEHSTAGSATVGVAHSRGSQQVLAFLQGLQHSGIELFAGKGTPRKLRDIQQGRQAASFEDDVELGVQ